MSENEIPTPPPPAPAPLPPLPPQAYAPPVPPPVAPPMPAPPRPQPGKSPAAAGGLSVFPGLGHLYLGLYQRGVVFFLVWVTLWVIADRTNVGPLGLLIPFWWVFVLIDAVRQARAINATGKPETELFAGEKTFKADGSLTFGILLMLVGAFFLIERFVTIDLSFLLDWWPALLIAFGAWQVWLYLTEKKRRDDAAKAAEAERIAAI